MSIIDGLLVVQRSIPTDVLAGLATGQFSLHGGVIRDSAGRIVRHLVSAAPGTALNPFGMLNAVPSLVNVYQLNQLTNMTQALLQISQTTMLLSGLNLAISVVGFSALYAGLRRVDKHIAALDQKVDWIKAFLSNAQRASFLYAIEQLDQLEKVAVPAASRHQILHSAHATLGQSVKFYLLQWQAAESLVESMSYQHYFCSAFLAQARCSAELDMYDKARVELHAGIKQWRTHAQSLASNAILGKNRARFLDARFADSVPAAKIAGWLEFASAGQGVRGYEWLDVLRRERGSSLFKIRWARSNSEDKRDIAYLDNLTSREGVLLGYEAQLQFMAENQIRPSVMASEIERLQNRHGQSDVLVLAPASQLVKRPVATIAERVVQEPPTVDRQTVFWHLAQLEALFQPKGYPVELNRFVQDYLTKKGYARSECLAVIDLLLAEGFIETYATAAPKSSGVVTAVRIAKRST